MSYAITIETRNGTPYLVGNWVPELWVSREFLASRPAFFEVSGSKLTITLGNATAVYQRFAAAGDVVKFTLERSTREPSA